MKPPKTFSGFPTRENCDLDDPYQAFLWMLVALPYQNGAQLVFPASYLTFVSKRLWDCGARPVAEPTIKYQKPEDTDPNWITSPGTWVPVDTPDRDPRRPVQRAADALLSPQQAELYRELRSRLSPEQRRMIDEQVDGIDGVVE